MVLVKMIAFVVLKILHSLISMQKSFFVNNCWRKQNQEKYLTWPYIYFGSTFRICY